MISSLSPPMTVDDPLGHLLDALAPHRQSLALPTQDLLARLDRTAQILAGHGEAEGPITRRIREEAVDLMRVVSADSRNRVALDLRLEARVQVPPHVLNEAEHAASALARLTRARTSPLWEAYMTQFWERYGVGVLVPLRDAVDLASGVGFPADYPMSVWPQMPPKALPRDEKLAALAMKAVMTGVREVVLTDADIDDLSADTGSAPTAPHAELGMRVRAGSAEAMDRGEFLVDVRPAWTAGVLSGRFLHVLGPGLSELYATLPTMVEGALPAQLSFPPVFTHGENVSRIPAVLPHVLSVGEHRARADHVIRVDDLAVACDGTRLYLVSVSRRRVIEPVVLNPLALEKQAPPLARFLAMIGRGLAAAWTAFDWGPNAASLPFLPQVRYRRAILTPARWRLQTSDLPPGPFTKEWHQALNEWAAGWRCPRLLDLYDDDRTVRLDLSEPLHARLLHLHLQRSSWAVLAEAVTDDELGWIGHAHEITMPLTAGGPQLPHPNLSDMPVLTNEQVVQGERWFQAKVFTHPSVMDQILTRHLPRLLQGLGTSTCWFVRYRSVDETDHLRIRVPAELTVADTVAAWVADLVADRLASHLVADSYRPEIGRYGTGPQMNLAEEVFIADSLLSRHALADVPGTKREVLCALSMIDLAEGLLGTVAGRTWMATTPAPGESDPSVSRAVVDLVRTPHLLHASERLAKAVAQRRETLGAYRRHVGNARARAVLESLLHMHHNRIMGPDRASEASARHAARQACRALLHQEAA